MINQGPLTDIIFELISKGFFKDTHSVIDMGDQDFKISIDYYNEKTKWRRLDESEQDFDMKNYKTAREANDALLQSFQEEEKLGMMYQIDAEVAARKWPGRELRVAALGAIQKPDGTYRVLHDGTHGVQVNCDIKMRDLVDSPRAGEAACVMQVCKQKGYPVYFALAGDIKKAHRRYKHRESDHGKLACRTEGDHGKL